MTNNTPTPEHQLTNIRFTILMYMAWRNIVNKKLRSLLTLTGVIIGIGSIFFLLSFGLGIQDLVTKQIIGNQSIKTIDVTTTNSRILKLDANNVSKMKALPHVTSGGVLYSYPGSLSKNGGSSDTITYGVNTLYQSMLDLTLTNGRLLSDTDKNAVVINESAAQAIGFTNPKDAIGKSINLLVPLQNADAKQSKFEHQYTVIGTIQTGSGSEIYIPSFYFDTAGVPAYSQVRLLVDDTSNIATLRKQVESYGFQTTSPSDTIEQVNQIFAFFNIILVGFGSISMIVAILGMFNTLTISLLERTKEIGLMTAMGSRSGDMSKLFIFEALFISVIGASIGILVAVILGQIINTILVSFAHGRGVVAGFQLFAVPFWLILSMIAFMALVGLIVAIIPARRAMKISPIDALRRE